MSSSTLSRASVVDATTMFVRYLNRKLEQLHERWDVVGLSNEMRGDRVEAVYKHLRHLLDQMVPASSSLAICRLQEEEESEMVKAIEEKIVAYREQVHELQVELQMNDLDESGLHRMEKVDLMPYLREKRDKLRALVNDRRAQYTALLAEDATLCTRLGVRPWLRKDKTPSEEELTRLRELCARRCGELRDRERDFLAGQAELRMLLTRMAMPPPNRYAEHVLETSVDDAALTDSEMAALATLLSLVRGQYADFVEQFRFRFDELQMEMQMWWDRCMVPSHERQLPTTLVEDAMHEQVLTRMRAEIARLREFYREREVVMASFEKWQRLWNEKLEHEQKQRDPGYYNNRGGNLVKELARVKELEKLLPRARDELMRAACEYDETHADSPITIGGRAPHELVDTIVEEYRVSKDLEKEEKVKKKKAQTEMEMRWGTAGLPPKSPARTMTPAKSMQQLQMQHVTGGLSVLRSPMKPTQSASTIKQHQLPDKVGSLKRNAATPSPALGAPSPRKHAPNPMHESLASIVDYHDFQRGIHGNPPGGVVAPDQIAHSSFMHMPPPADALCQKPPLPIGGGAQRTPKSNRGIAARRH